MSREKWDALIAAYLAFLPRAEDDAKSVIWDEINRLRALQLDPLEAP